MTAILRLPVLLLGFALLFGSPAAAQFRPPPISEAERLSAKGDEYRIEANAALLEGNKSRAKERFEKAIEAYLKALSANPSLVVAAVGLGEAAGVLGQHEQIITSLTPLVEANPEQLDLAYSLGVALLKTQKYERAVPLLERVSAGNRVEHLIVHYYLGRYYVVQGRADHAIAELRKYLAQRPEKLAPNDFEIHQLLGHSHLLLGEGALARKAFERAQAGRPENLAMQMGIAAALELEGKTTEALTLLDGLSKRFPNEPEPRERLGWLALSRNDLPRAQAAGQSALKLKETATVRQLIGEVALRGGKAADAERELKRAIALDPRLLRAHIAHAMAIQHQKRHDEAVGLLEALMGQGSPSIELLSALGSSYRRAGRFQEAVLTHQKVVQLMPERPTGHLLLGADHFATGEWDQAIEDYGRALKLEPTNRKAQHWLALALTHRARGLARANQLDDALRDLRRAADLERTAAISRTLGAVLLTAQAFTEAQTVLSRSVTLPGANWKDHLLLGYANLGAKQPLEALKAFENSARQTKDAAIIADIYAGWALAKLELGDFDAAVTKLAEPGKSGAAGVVTQNNLPLALLRRALERLRTGDIEGAAKDVEAGERLTGKASPDVVRLVHLTRALLEVEQGNSRQAALGLKRAFAKKSANWEHPHTEDLVRAYVAYRSDDLRNARKYLGRTRSRVKGTHEFLLQLERAMDRRDGELAYSKGAVARAEKILRKALEDDPLNAHVSNNLACAMYRRGKVEPAVTSWVATAATLPESALNLGIDSQVRRENFQDAVDHYAHYVARGSRRVAEVREWKERLQAIYGIAEPDLTNLKKEDGAAAAPSDAPGGAPTPPVSEQTP